jgi:hypothetical protein
MAIISRGFSGKRKATDAKLPPGQYLTTDFPVYLRTNAEQQRRQDRKPSRAFRTTLT